ncbi:hypothetical protein [Gilvibacter sp.]|uniref:hypothetical protein n=1 Tax=Gilvibacter sp. TaxID=2729997 RepID=UPI003F49D4C7
MREFNYDISKFDFDFFGDSKIDVFLEEELILEILKIDNSLWLVQTFKIEDNLIPIRQERANKLIQLVRHKTIERFDQELEVVLHPNFFMVIDTLNSN